MDVFSPMYKCTLREVESGIGICRYSMCGEIDTRSVVEVGLLSILCMSSTTYVLSLPDDMQCMKPARRVQKYALHCTLILCPYLTEVAQIGGCAS